MANPWPLYLFCVVELIGFFIFTTVIVFWPRPCFLYGKECTSAETVLANFCAYQFLGIALLFFTLTHRNRDRPEKIKRIAYFAIYSTVANLSAFMMIGSSSVAGMMKTGYNALILLVLFIVFFALAKEVQSDAPMVATAPFREGLGFNLKGLFTLYCIMILMWIFANSDFQTIDSVFPDETEMTEVANMLWNFWSVLILQLLFVFIDALAYDDDDDREALAIVYLVVMVYGYYYIWSLSSLISASLVSMNYIQNTVLIVLTLAAIIRYRMTSRRSDYETVSSTNV